MKIVRVFLGFSLVKFEDIISFSSSIFAIHVCAVLLFSFLTKVQYALSLSLSLSLSLLFF